MKKILQWLRAVGFRVEGQARSATPAAPGSAPWTTEDKGRWQQFLGSDTGARFIERMRAVEFGNYQNSCADAMHTAHSAGRARGFSDAREWLESLSRVTCVTVTEVSGPLNSPEHDAQRPEGEAELRERWSP